MSYGENISIQKAVLRKRGRAVRGFRLPLLDPKRRRKLRRQRRDSSKIKRYSKRGKRTNRRKARRSVRHWSEKKLRRLRKNAHGYRRTALAKKFSCKLRGKFATRFALGRLQRKGVTHPSPVFYHKASSTLRETLRVTAIRPTAATIESVSCLRDRERV